MMLIIRDDIGCTGSNCSSLSRLFNLCENDCEHQEPTIGPPIDQISTNLQAETDLGSDVSMPMNKNTLVSTTTVTEQHQSTTL